MANIKYYPEDLLSNQGSIGIKLPMNGRSGTPRGGLFNLSYSTEEQAVSNYVNLLLTRKGERYMQPEFGIAIQDYLFEPNTDVIRTEIEFEIRRQSGFWLPYIVNHDINVKPRAEILGLAADPENAIQIIITFSVTESGANQTIVLYQIGGVTNINII